LGRDFKEPEVKENDQENVNDDADNSVAKQGMKPDDFVYFCYNQIPDNSLNEL
jgi:hypothetical protein